SFIASLFSKTVLTTLDVYCHCVGATRGRRRWQILSSSCVRRGDLEKIAERPLRRHDRCAVKTLCHNFTQTFIFHQKSDDKTCNVIGSLPTGNIFKSDKPLLDTCVRYTTQNQCELRCVTRVCRLIHHNRDKRCFINFPSDLFPITSAIEVISNDRKKLHIVPSVFGSSAFIVPPK
ncbi:hypothetical protein D4764_13G0011640, partial [Takifugu flavidus]